MKISIGKMIVLLAIIFSLVTVSSTWAKECDIPVDGFITEIVSNGAITVDDGTPDGTIVYGIPLNYLTNQDIDLIKDDYVEINAILCNITGLVEACTLSVDIDGDGVLDEVNLPGKRGL